MQNTARTSGVSHCTRVVGAQSDLCPGFASTRSLVTWNGTRGNPRNCLCTRRSPVRISARFSEEVSLARLKSEERRKRELKAELDSLTRSAQGVELDKVQVKRGLSVRVADAKNLLQRQASQARQNLRKVLVQPLSYEVIEENGKQGFEVTGEGFYISLLNGVASPLCGVPNGI